ncbi:hypothetical protein BGX27_000532 [Mortierella sp. AM989]|nr:hypothetical protein BGX27_000532 [Mortierella sp. AM989]
MAGTATYKIHPCPMCNERVYGDDFEFENHVQSHFLDDFQSTQEEEKLPPSTPPAPSLTDFPDLQDFPDFLSTQEEEKIPPSIPPALSPPDFPDFQDFPDFPDSLLDPQFDIECDAPGCDLRVNINEMAEHMDRHFAEQIQNQGSARNFNAKVTLPDINNFQSTSSQKRSYPDKQSRSASPELSSRYDAEEAEFDFTTQDDDSPYKKARSDSLEKSKLQEDPASSTKSTGQTTMDRFIKKTLGTGISKLTKFTFAPDASSSDTVGTPGLITKAKMLLNISKAQGITKQAYLADPSVVFIQGDKSDRGWGCGYRNLQMMLSYVVNHTSTHEDKEYRKNRTAEARSLSNPIPTIAELQQQLDFAWKNGFDPQGAKQLKGEIIGTKKWIGTTDVWSILSSLGIRCSILDFHTPTGPKGTHPAMIAAIYNYFCTPTWLPLEAPEMASFYEYVQLESEQRIIQTAKPPLYIQHQGHSRTVIGIEVLTTGELNLLIFDPGRWLHKAIPNLREESIAKRLSPTFGRKDTTTGGFLDAQYLLKAFRLSPDFGLSKPQYQLLGISGLYNDENSKNEHARTRKECLELFKKDASLSIGWNDEEADQSKLYDVYLSHDEIVAHWSMVNDETKMFERHIEERE